MTEFAKYIERRDRVEAFQFTQESQAAEVVRALELAYDDTRWSLHRTGLRDFHLIITPPAKRGPEVRVNRGDFILRRTPDDWPYAVTTFEIVPSQEFRKAWEAESG